MKRTLLAFFVISAFQQVCSEPLPAEVEAKLLHLIDQYAIQGGHSAPDSGIFLNYAATNKISQNDVYDVVEHYADDRYEKIKAETVESAQARQNVHNFHQILVFIGKTRDQRWIPFIRKVYALPDKNIRTSVVLAYIDLMGADSIEFVEKGVSNQDFETRSHSIIYRKMQSQLKTASSEGREKILRFFLRRMENATGASDQEDIDRVLTDNFSEYRTSVQHKKYAERFLKSDFEFARKRGKEILQEVEKVPVEQRKDLSNLLQKPADEVKAQ